MGHGHRPDNRLTQDLLGVIVAYDGGEAWRVAAKHHRVLNGSHALGLLSADSSCCRTAPLFRLCQRWCSTNSWPHGLLERNRGRGRGRGSIAMDVDGEGAQSQDLN